MLMVELWLSFLYGSYNGGMVVALTEIVPRDVRTTGFSLAYSLATALFGGFTPLVTTWLIDQTGNSAAPVCGWRSGAYVVSARRWPSIGMVSTRTNGSCRRPWQLPPNERCTRHRNTGGRSSGARPV